MGTTWNIQVRVAKGIVVFNLVIIAIGVIISKNWKPFVIGNICGSVAAIVNFRLLAISMEGLAARKGHGRGKVIKYTGSRALARLLISGVIIYLSLISKNISAIGAVIGLLSIKPIILIQSFLYK